MVDLIKAKSVSYSASAVFLAIFRCFCGVPLNIFMNIDMNCGNNHTYLYIRTRFFTRRCLGVKNSCFSVLVYVDNS